MAGPPRVPARPGGGLLRGGGSKCLIPSTVEAHSDVNRLLIVCGGHASSRTVGSLGNMRCSRYSFKFAAAVGHAKTALASNAYGSDVDPTLTGALIGLGGAAIGAVATSAVPIATLRARRRDELQKSQRDQVGELLESLVAYVHARAARNMSAMVSHRAEAVVAGEKLLMLASSRDARHIERVTRFVLNNSDAHPELVSAGVEAAAQVLRRWVRGDLHGRRISDAYEPALTIQLDMREQR